jgi:thiazole synthase
LNPHPEAVEEAIQLGCPVVRLLSGRIGGQTGILDPAAVSATIARAKSIPIILEGGIATPAHIRESARLGAAGVLMNSVFRLSTDPITRARELREAADDAWLLNAA